MSPTRASPKRRTVWGGAVSVVFASSFVLARRTVRTERTRPDRAIIDNDWIRRVIDQPVRTAVQADGRVRRGAAIAEAGGRVLRVVLLPDRVTVHNAFFDRSYKP